MNKKEIEQIKRTKKSKRNVEDYINYFIFIFPLSIAFIGFILLLSYFMHNAETQSLLISLIMITLGLLFAYFTLKRLNENVTFETIENQSNLNLIELKQQIQNTFRLNSIFIYEKLGTIEALTKLTGFSWGELITIIQDGNTFLVNSRPNGTNQPVTVYKDRKNIKKIRNILTQK
ncbi:hypothetical protein [Mucilaginibacter arboris]|uniref:Uncharacterized protein n=1 Tax=Mucilaginibacter arboris TaxID=2682090 RepID=A0A7K1SXP8_9SPHI|nr:hypothetical protein [Mucilaginibacter arboris]MVN21790.1 hypothetical protein [Mucilaginibacter arboris]